MIETRGRRERKKDGRSRCVYIYIYIQVRRGKGERSIVWMHHGRPRSCSLARDPFFLLLLLLPHSTRANSRDGQIKTDNSRARPRFGPTSASGSAVSSQSETRLDHSCMPLSLPPSPPLYPLPFFDRVNAFVIEEV